MRSRASSSPGEGTPSLAAFVVSALLHAAILGAAVEIVTSPEPRSLPTWSVAAGGGITVFVRPLAEDRPEAQPAPAERLDLLPERRVAPPGGESSAAATALVTPAPAAELAFDASAPAAAAATSREAVDESLPPLAGALAPLPAADVPEPILSVGLGGLTSEATPDGARNRPPDYPAEARRRKWEGTVILRVEVEADGTVRSCDVAVSSGHAVLDDAARAAVRRWRFAPARLAGSAVAARVEVPVRFQLAG